MPGTPTYPGVYIEEVPSGVRAIIGVATSVAAFVDRFAGGPVETPVRIFSMADFEREFGGPELDSAASYGIRQFFLNGGTEAYVVRVATAGSAAASVVLNGSGGAEIVRVTAGRRVGRVSVEDHGEWGEQLRVEVDYDTTDPAETFNLLISEVAEVGGRMVVRQTKTFRNLTMEPGRPNNALEVVNAGSKLVQLDRADLADDLPEPWDPAFRPDPTGTLGSELPALTATIDYAGANPPESYAENGRTAHLEMLVPRRVTLRDVSSRDLLDAIRGEAPGAAGGSAVEAPRGSPEPWPEPEGRGEIDRCT